MMWNWEVTALATGSSLVLYYYNIADYYRLDDVELGGDCPGYWLLPGPLLL